MTGCNGNVRVIERRDALLRWARKSGAVVAIALLAFGACRLYGGWRKQHLATQTQQFVARGDYQSAVLVARRLLELDQNNIAACRAMAEMAEKAGRAEAIEWRRKVSQLDPKIAADQFALARSALRFGQVDLTDRVLKSLGRDVQNGVEYHQLAGAVALARKQTAEAEAHFAAALRISPDDPTLALHLALIHLGSSSNPRILQEARHTVTLLAEQASVRVECLRALAADALARDDQKSARFWAAQLEAENGTTFADALLCFQAVAGTDAAAAALERLQVKAAGSPATVAQLITWLNRRGMAQEALRWASSLPAASSDAHPVPFAIAESYSFLHQWEQLTEFVAGKNWGANEALRLAVESHALRRLSPPERPSIESQNVWQAALKAAQSNPPQLVAIAQLAEGWGYLSDAEEAWWTVANSNGNPQAGLSALQRLYQQKQDTRGLLRVAKRAVELNPADLVAANNCASLGLLLSGDSTSRRLASKLHTEHPTNGAFTATYAFALQTEGKLPDALKVIETLRPEELRIPAIAAYYFVMLVESGEIHRAEPYLEIARTARLLPEETQLVNAATRKLADAQSSEHSGVAEQG